MKVRVIRGRKDKEGIIKKGFEKGRGEKKIRNSGDVREKRGWVGIR
jgi:hypothetical protein